VTNEHKLKEISYAVGYKRAKYVAASIRFLRQHTKECIGLLRYKRELIITKNGKPVAALISIRNHQMLTRQRLQLIRDQIETEEYDEDIY
jgi:prevent-host-death family protein